MADLSAIPQNQLLGRLAGFLRFLEKDRPEFLPSELGAMQAASKLMLPQASTVENLSYGNLPFTMPPSGTGAMIPQVKTGRKAEVADLVGMITGVPGGRAVADVGIKLSNEAADALVRMITRNPQATAPAVLQETAMPFMNAIAPRQPGLLSPQKSELGFYSALEQATMPLQNKGTGAQFLAQIEKTPGVKPEELKWTGLDEFLRSRQNVTKAEVQDYLNANRVNLQEVRLGGQRTQPMWDENRLLAPDDSIIGQMVDDGTGTYKFVMSDGTVIDTGENRMLQSAEFIESRFGVVMGNESQPKFSSYTLPGGENYREILLTMPGKATKFQVVDESGIPMSGQMSSQVDAQNYINRYKVPGGMFGNKEPKIVAVPDKELQYKSSHFDQPNILAHMRVNDRVVDGKKTLFIEEVQSDWHQAGRKKGYATKPSRSITDIENEASQVNRERSRLLDEAAALPDSRMAEFNAMNDRIRELTVRARQLGDEFDAAMKPKDVVPDAPFKTIWHELTLKRAIQEASEKGYDQIAFTTGKTQAERYDLSKQVDEINVTARTSQISGEQIRTVALDTIDGQSIKLAVQSNGIVGDVSSPSARNFVGQNLSDIVGKELAEKIMKEGSQTISGEGLRVGGKGMEGFYDQILPKSLEKLGKKFDAKVGKTEMDGVEVWQMDITPKMRESVLTKGQPLFAATPVLPAGLLGRDEEE